MRGRREEALSNDQPELISVDWGTSSLRAYLADADGRALRRSTPRKGLR
jgi:2-keto-3-deoxy-galactonokinase